MVLARRPVQLLLILSVVVIGGALGSQRFGRLVPCELCLKERWPWYAAIALSLLFLAWRRTRVRMVLAAVLAAIFLGSAGLAFYHVGVEQHVFAGPDTCTAPAPGGHSLEDLRRQLLATPPVRCDEVQWSLFGVSLAGWNLLASIAGLALAAAAWRHSVRGHPA